MGTQWLDESSCMVSLLLPWPPTVNHYWKRSYKRFYVGEKGVNYRNEVVILASKFKNSYVNNERLRIDIEAHPPDKRRRDLDNIFKCLLDSLQYAGVYSDDNQLDQIYIERKTPRNGQLLVTIKELKRDIII